MTNRTDDIAPLVSVAMATYNGEQFLREQLDSVYRQTHGNIQVVVTDDGSTDSTREILDEYKRLHGLKYYLNERQLGYVRNFERATSLCRGDYIALCDQDDIWRPEKIETLLHSLRGYSLVYSDASLIDAQGNCFAPSYSQYVNAPRLTGKPLTELLFECFVRGFQMLFSREVLARALPIPAGITHDDWFCIVAAKLNGIRYVEEPLVAYRQHGTNATAPLTRFHPLRAALDGVKRLLDRHANRELRGYYRSQVLKHENIAKHPVFTEAESRLIGEVSCYWRDRAESTLHWKALLIALKHTPAIVPQKGPLGKLKFLIASLVRP